MWFAPLIVPIFVLFIAKIIITVSIGSIILRDKLAHFRIKIG